MELIETIMVAMMAGMTNTIINMIWAILQSLIYCVVNVSIIDDYAYVKLLDRYVAAHGICPIRNFDHSRTPESGFHFVITWKWKIPTGILIAQKTIDFRSTGKYTVYWIGPGIRDLRIKIIGDQSLIYERAVTMLRPDNPIVQTRRVKTPDSANLWQAKIIDLISADFAKNSRSSWFICGPPGCGKTTIGLLIAKHLVGPGVTPVLVTGVDFMTPGLSIKEAYYTPIATEPVIIVLNEFDCAIRHAERDPSKDSTGARESTCISNTPTLMLNTLDYMASTPFLIIIATTNMRQSELVTGIYQRYTRAGRFDNHYQVRDNEAGARLKPGRGRIKKMRAA